MASTKTVFAVIAVMFAASWSGARGERIMSRRGFNFNQNAFHRPIIRRDRGNGSGDLWRLRGGGAERDHGVPASTFQPHEIFAGIPSLWHELLLPLLRDSPQRIRDSLLHQQAYQKRPETSVERESVPAVTGSESHGRRRGSHPRTDNNSSSAPATVPTLESSATTAVSFQSLLLPSRILKLSLLAFVIAEILDRLGILYEDAPAILKSQLEAFWYYDVEPTLMLWKAYLQEFHERRIRPHLPPVLTTRGTLRGEDLRGHVVSFLSATKVAFAVGASLGMIASPVMVHWTLLYWKPSLALYALAEANHYCKRWGQKLVQRLGETPQTLGATLDGILDQCRNLVRRVVLGRKVVTDGSVVSPTVTTILGGSDATVSLLRGAGGGGNDGHPSEGSSRKNVEWWSSSSSRDVRTPKSVGYSLGLSSPRSSETSTTQDETLIDLQGLVDEFKGWMVVHPTLNQGASSRHSVVHGNGDNDAPVNPRGAMIKHGFWAGCAIGLAILGM